MFFAAVMFLSLVGCSDAPKDKPVATQKPGPVAGLKQATEPSEKFKTTLKKAQEGDPASQRDVGSMYLEGKEVAKDPKGAVEWLTKSAEQGDSWAEYGLGNMYRAGNGVKQDYGKAMAWFKKSAAPAQGNQAGQLAVADMMIKGEGVSKDVQEGLRIISRLAQDNYSWAQYFLGDYYITGEFAPKDDREAAKWFRKAADQGNQAAKERLKAIGQTSSR
jgi:hypothetical protein